ncbi:hypothetical protein EJ06DRAFT_554559 [Trichodelitschia bisporula]|uniref:Thioredoxin domain-containing protein n=1 Tax=Trichodelitschia bisporula TaxID=703511 RepID=A0A6G1I4N5_9PEZI|nr:hypothetical protein EJ06DRAFT_554559 [Trichodelitschia bisporula]
MAGHTELNSKADFEAAVGTKGKYVLIYAYSGEVPAAAEAAAEKHASSTDAYKVDVEKHPAAKEYFKVSVTPTVVIFKDGTEIKKVEGVSESNAAEVASVLV